MQKKGIGEVRLDLQIVLAAGFCLLLGMFIPQPYYQTMTACIATLLCVQDNVKLSWKAGLNRIIITIIGGLVAIMVILADNLIQNRWVFLLMFMAGLMLTLFGCKLAGMPYINARIGGITFILVALTRAGAERIEYAAFRVVSTLVGILAVLAVAALFQLIAGGRGGKKAEGKNAL